MRVRVGVRVRAGVRIGVRVSVVVSSTWKKRHSQVRLLKPSSQPFSCNLGSAARRMPSVATRVQ